MTWKTKLSIIVGVIVAFCGLLLVIKYQRDIINKQNAIQNSLVEMKKLQGDITRAQTQYATPSDIDKLAASLDIKLGPIKDDLKTLNARVTGVQTVIVHSGGENKTDIASTTTETRPDIPVNEPLDPFGYQKSAQTLALTEPFGKVNVPVADLTFKAWEKAPWTVVEPPRQYSSINVLGKDEDGKTYTYSKFSVTTAGKTYNIDIADSKLVEELPQSKFRWSPHLFLGADFGTAVSGPKFEMMPDLELMLFSYGQSYPYEWEFLGLGGGWELNYKSLQFIISPVNYNIGKHIPFMSNLFIGPSIGVDTHGNFSLLGGIKVGL